MSSKRVRNLESAVLALIALRIHAKLSEAGLPVVIEPDPHVARVVMGKPDSTFVQLVWAVLNDDVFHVGWKVEFMSAEIARADIVLTEIAPVIDPINLDGVYVSLGILDGWIEKLIPQMQDMTMQQAYKIKRRQQVSG